MPATWKPHDKQGRLSKRSDLPDSVFAYPKDRKEPMTNAAHVRNALARFDQVKDVSDAQRSSAFANIKRAAKHFNVDIAEQHRTELGSKPSSGSTKATRKKATSRGAMTRKRKAAPREKRAKAKA